MNTVRNMHLLHFLLWFYEIEIHVNYTFLNCYMYRLCIDL